jgi:hypothetical protein
MLEDRNKVMTANEISNNGLAFMEHAWNTRSLMKPAVAQLLNSHRGGHCIYLKFQEYANTISRLILPN